MIDYHNNLVSALNTVLPTYYELALTNKIKTPCISYQERNNFVSNAGDTIGYSRIIYTVKVWSSSIQDLQRYSLMVDSALRKIGFKRTSTNELSNNDGSMIQKIMTFEALALEDY